jgi:hypothetical protein
VIRARSPAGPGFQSSCVIPAADMRAGMTNEVREDIQMI